MITRLQVQRQLRRSSATAEEGEYKGVLDAFDHIYHKEGGISAFYGGVWQDTAKSLSDSFLFFLFHNYMRTRRLQVCKYRLGLLRLANLLEEAWCKCDLTSSL